MRTTPLLPILCVACGGPTATVEGTALGITWGETEHVYYGGPFIVISNREVDCEGVAWTERNYEDGHPPTEEDTQILQFAFGEDDFAVNSYSVSTTSSVAATVLSIDGGALSQEFASEGLLVVESIEKEEVAEGNFGNLLFDSGTLAGTFTAEWCRNLKP